MSELVSLLAMLNSISPLAVIALLGIVIYKLITNHKEIKENDLHTLPDILETLQRIEVTQSAAFGTIIAKLNGRT